MGWREFVTDYRIPYKRGSGGENIEIHCPMCGYSDKNKHLGLSLTTSLYGCWRDPQHRGKHPARLIASLLGISRDEAMRLTRQYFNLDLELLGKRGKIEFDIDVKPAEKPPTFCTFTGKDQLENQFVNYLKRRGFDPKWVINRYGLQWSIGGQFSYRIIIPILFGNQWMTWAARTISDNVNPKYKMASEKEGVIVKPSDFLHDFQNLRGGKLLVLCEGAFDSFKVTAASIPGVSATCLFGKNITEKQKSMLMDLSKQYDSIALAYDPDALKQAIPSLANLKWYIPNLTFIHPSGKDFGAMDADAIRRDLRPWAA